MTAQFLHALAAVQIENSYTSIRSSKRLITAREQQEYSPNTWNTFMCVIHRDGFNLNAVKLALLDEI